MHPRIHRPIPDPERNRRHGDVRHLHLHAVPRHPGGHGAGRRQPCLRADRRVLPRSVPRRASATSSSSTAPASTTSGCGALSGRLFGNIVKNPVLVALPMFIFMGLMLDQSGVAQRMMHSMQKLFGGLRGGLSLTVLLIGIILAASTGVIGASVTLLGVMALPAMMAQNYSKPIATGTIASAGTLGILIPPSIMLVIMSDQLAISPGRSVHGGAVPGPDPGRALHRLHRDLRADQPQGDAAARKDRRGRLAGGQGGAAGRRAADVPDPAGAGLDLRGLRHADRGLGPGRAGRDVPGAAQRQAELQGPQGSQPLNAEHLGLHRRHLPGRELLCLSCCAAMAGTRSSSIWCSRPSTIPT